MKAEIETARTILTAPSLDLVEHVQTAIAESKPELSVYFAWLPKAISEPEKNMEDAIEKLASFSGELRYYIIDKSTGMLLGAIGLIIRNKDVPFFEIGYWIRTSQTGKGFVSEAVNALENYAFNELKAHRIEIRAADINLKSRSVAERCGYLLDCVLENERRLPNGTLANTVVYSKCR